METRYYEVSGAEENSAMSSAEGRVQNLGYDATFPLLINISGQPTYFMALKDDAGLVKQYAMLNIEKYQTVAIGDSVLQCESNYKQLLKDNGIIEEPVPEEKETKNVTGIIEDIVQVVVEGNSHFYVTLVNSKEVYDVAVKDVYEIVKYKQGDKVSIDYTDETGLKNVKKIKIISND